LSGRPVFEKSTIALANFRKRLGTDFPIIGVGGIDSPQTALQKLEAGANLIQLYTGMVYEGPLLASRINTGLICHMEQNGISSLSQITSTNNEEWASRPIA